MSSGLALGRRSPRDMRVLGAATGALLVVAAISSYALVMHLGGGGANSSAYARPQTVAHTAPIVSAAGLARRSGVRLVRVAVTGNGGLIDLRYQVIDPGRANSVHDRKTPPVLVDESDGLIVRELLMGHMHHGQLKAGQSYYLIFLNPGNLVHSGARMTVRLGDARVAHIPVQ